MDVLMGGDDDQKPNQKEEQTKKLKPKVGVSSLSGVQRVQRVVQ